MSFYTQQKTTVVIDADNSVIVRKLTYGEQQAAISAGMIFDIGMSAGVPTKGRLDPVRIKEEQLIASIVSWSGPGFDDRTVTRENVLALPSEIIDDIQKAIDELNTGLGADEKKALSDSTSTP